MSRSHVSATTVSEGLPYRLSLTCETNQHGCVAGSHGEENGRDGHKQRQRGAELKALHRSPRHLLQKLLHVVTRGDGDERVGRSDDEHGKEEKVVGEPPCLEALEVEEVDALYLARRARLRVASCCIYRRGGKIVYVCACVR